MTDRELLEKAAKAAGYRLHIWGTEGAENVARMDTPSPTKWNPLKDDGDAFRLAVQLKIVWVYRTTFVVIEDGTSTIGEPFGYDPRAATRRAIVRAAATLCE
jgi:hypothetical protein